MKVLGAIRIVSAADTYRRSFHVLSLSESDSYCLTHAITHAISQFTLSFFRRYHTLLKTGVDDDLPYLTFKCPYKLMTLSAVSTSFSHVMRNSWT